MGDCEFDELVFEAHKLGVLTKLTNELVEDSPHNVEGLIRDLFVIRMKEKEEDAFFSVDGKHKPIGIIHQAQVGATSEKKGAITFDDVVDLYHSVKIPYRKNAVWLISEEACEELKKFKTNDGIYLWTEKTGKPDTFLGKPVYTTTKLGVVESGSKPILFGDFSYFWIAERGKRNIMRLSEKYAHQGMIGYLTFQRVDAKLVDPETAPVVREVYRRAIDGESFGSIARDLNARGITGVYGGRWQTGRIAYLLENEKYCGNALLQKRFRNNHIEKKEKTNKGELTQYYAVDTHEAIIDEATFDAAQEILQRYKAQKAMQAPCEESAFTGKIVCSICGKKYKRITSNGKKSWCCYTYRNFGKSACPSKQIPEEELYRIATEVTNTFDKIMAVTADENNTLI